MIETGTRKRTMDFRIERSNSPLQHQYDKKKENKKTRKSNKMNSTI